MEIREYLRTVRRRLWIVPLVPALAGGLAFAALRDEPQRYVASVAVEVPWFLAGSPTDSAVGLYVESFREMVRSDPVVREAASRTGLGEGAIRDGVEVLRRGRSNVIQVSFTGERPSVPPGVVVILAREALVRLAEPSLAAAEDELELARQDYDRAWDAVRRFTDRTGLILPRESYLNLADEVGSLELGVADATASGEVTREAALQSLLRRKRRAMAELAPLVTRFQLLEDAVAAARASLGAARERVLEESVRLELARTSLVSQPASASVPAERTIARGVGMAGGVGLFLALGLLWLLDLVRPPARARDG